MWCFQYKILRNTLYLSQKLFLFCKHNTSLYSFCNLEDKTVIHLFVHCSKTIQLWCTVIEYFNRNIHIIPQSAIFGFLEADDKVFLILNHLWLLLKYYICLKQLKNSFFWSHLEIHHESKKAGKNLKSKWWKEKKLFTENNSAKFVKL